LPPGFFAALYARFARAEVWRVYDDVRPCLDVLASRSVKLAIVSNWDERLHPLLDELKLTSYFDAIIISCDIGFTKPSPVIFEQALRKLGVPPAAVLHVGDSQTEDVDGAAAAGMKSLLLRRSDGVFPRELGSLRELEGVVPPFED
jgi:putative hydrolase of the HAD superfamily